MGLFSGKVQILPVGKIYLKQNEIKVFAGCLFQVGNWEGGDQFWKIITLRNQK